jgi:hypothetical protein
MKTLNRAQALSLLAEMMQADLQAFDTTPVCATHPQERKWLIKKADTHPKLVEQAMRLLMAEAEIKGNLSRLQIAADTLSAAALLHDLGRLQEVDFTTGTIRLTQEQHPYTHSEVSYEILREKGIDDPQILLPIRYHDHYCFEEGLGRDSLFLTATPTEREKIKYIWLLLIDADRLGNIAYIRDHSFHGMQEEMSPKYHSAAMISAEMKKLALAKHVFSCRDTECEKTFADVLVRCIANINICHFAASKKIMAQNYLEALYGHLCAELNTAPREAQERAQALQDAREIFEFYKAEAEMTQSSTITSGE